jgi:DNA repair exonuclease SbcCD ATPase subunit
MSTEQPNEIDQRLELIQTELREYRRLQEGQAAETADLRRISSELLDIAQIHQQALRLSQQNFDTMQVNFDTMQGEIRGLRTESRRILERLEQHVSNGHGDAE